MDDAIPSVCDTIMEVALAAVAIIVMVATLPAWIILFVFWYLTQWKRKEQDSSVSEKDTRKEVRKKILPSYFAEVRAERKNFELRKDEDDIQVGDTLVLCEWDGEQFTGAEVSRTVKYVLRDVQEYGLKEGYCVIGW